MNFKVVMKRRYYDGSRKVSEFKEIPLKAQNLKEAGKEALEVSNSMPGWRIDYIEERA